MGRWVLADGVRADCFVSGISFSVDMAPRREGQAAKVTNFIEVATQGTGRASQEDLAPHSNQPNEMAGLSFQPQLLMCGTFSKEHCEGPSCAPFFDGAGSGVPRQSGVL